MTEFTASGSFTESRLSPKGRIPQEFQSGNFPGSRSKLSFLVRIKFGIQDLKEFREGNKSLFGILKLDSGLRRNDGRK
jgi:hypothetical protein